MRFKDQHIVVLGGKSGIGLAVAQAALGEGACVTVASSQQDSVDRAREDLASRASHKSSAHRLDVTDEQALKEFFGRAGAFDHLVFTSGENLPLALLGDKDLVKARAGFEVRYWGAIVSVKHGMGGIRKGGSIVLTSGFSSMRRRAGWTSQASIQSALEGLTRALAVELAPIRVNAVSPGLSRTPRWNSWEESFRQAAFEQEEKRLPLGRLGEAVDLATAYLYLMENSFATGTVVVVDGGGALI